ncbi:MAG: UDP-N-acetylmuramoylalanyl-D-glutamyl-2, 6-diaminopimelate--D-alanyl-D-alanine ligase, partial [Desulfovibrionaceae bacterium]|nr:UDP-N-acetylmuramoylalanyl-D-glutamyl-2, 6-diaminopimelate--D-alanyl-D-alanine ligase [Desulfovibrionaceae bacterium]
MVTGVARDNRDIVPGDLFVCIPGERVDGHDFAMAAVQAGAAAVLARRELPEVPPSVPVLRVDDTVKALGRLAAAWRMRTRAKVVGITGTAGKTTVKEVLAQVLSVQGPTERTAKNHNNQIGLPLSILNAAEDAAFWVMEAGISHAQDMEELAPVLRPDIGLVLNAGAGHTAGLGGRGVA